MRHEGSGLVLTKLHRDVQPLLAKCNATANSK